MKTRPIEKLPTRIPGFDHVADGGLPKGRTTLVAGTADSSKTVLATRFLTAGIREAGENGVFVTFEETAADETGMRVGDPLRGVSGILGGNTRQAGEADMAHIQTLFPRG